MPLRNAADVVTAKLHKDVRRVKILTLDIETMFATLQGFSLWNQNFSIDKIVKPSRIVCVASKWLGEKPVVTSEWEHGPEGMLRDTFERMAEADVVVHFNGDNFDIRHLQWEFARLGWARPMPYKSIDLLKVVRRNFRPMSNKLDFVAQQLGLGAKVSHSGFSLWQGVENGDPKARKMMVKYAAGDVTLEEKLYLRLLPWLPSNVNLPLLAGNDRGCPNCGALAVKSEGDSTFTALTEYALYSCASCQSWYRSNVVKNRTTRRIVR